MRFILILFVLIRPLEAFAALSWPQVNNTTQEGLKSGQDITPIELKVLGVPEGTEAYYVLQSNTCPWLKIQGSTIVGKIPIKPAKTPVSESCQAAAVAKVESPVLVSSPLDLAFEYTAICPNPVYRLKNSSFCTEVKAYNYKSSQECKGELALNKPSPACPVLYKQDTAAFTVGSTVPSDGYLKALAVPLNCQDVKYIISQNAAGNEAGCTAIFIKAAADMEGRIVSASGADLPRTWQAIQSQPPCTTSHREPTFCGSGRGQTPCTTVLDFNGNVPIKITCELSPKMGHKAGSIKYRSKDLKEASSCRHVSHSFDRFASCGTDPSYFPCRHESHGVESCK